MLFISLLAWFQRAGKQIKHDKGNLGSDREREGTGMEVEERSTIITIKIATTTAAVVVPDGSW